MPLLSTVTIHNRLLEGLVGVALLLWAVAQYKWISPIFNRAWRSRGQQFQRVAATAVLTAFGLLLIAGAVVHFL